MSYPVETLESATLPGEEDELPTNRLSSGALDEQSDQTLPRNADRYDQAEIDWLARLTTRSMPTEVLPDEPPGPQPEPSGMAQHAAPSRMVPTLGARLSTALRRSALLLLLALLAAGALGAGGYVLATTAWLSNITSPTPSQPASGQDQVEAGGTQSQPPADRQEATTGSARELRDQGIEQYRAGNYAQAVVLLESAMSLAGDDALAAYHLGLAYLAAPEREHSLDDAELAFRTAQSLQPDWAAPQLGLAESLLRRGFYKEAIVPAREATRLDPTLAEAWMLLGRAYQGVGQEAEATRAFAEASRLSPPPPMQP